jgi:hypothetical protein
MNKRHNIKTQIERIFWHQTIPMLSSGNRAVATLVNVGSYFYPRVQAANFFIKAIFWACIGLSLGLGIGIVFG